MAEKCEKCTENCPQAERAHQAALGRMYATKEFIALLKKVESGELVEVVRCKDCKYCRVASWGERLCARKQTDGVYAELSNLREDDFCSYGERKEA